MGYWEDRQAAVQAELTKKNVAAVERQVGKYYADTQRKIIGQFQQTYNHILSSIEAGRQPTPADLYKLDTYWQMQAEVTAELTKLGNKQAEILNRAFIMQYKSIYEATAIEGLAHFNLLDTQAIDSMINAIWCADGKHWSSRIWKNTSELQETLNQELIDCLVTGRNPTYLKQRLMQSFNVSYARADSLVRTEMAHIQIQAAEQRYIDSGVNYIEVWADKDERQCEVCGKLHKKVFPIGVKVPIPAHPNCRCSILPVIEELRQPVAEPKDFKPIPIRK